MAAIDHPSRSTPSPFLRRPARMRPEGPADPMPGPKAPVIFQHKRTGPKGRHIRSLRWGRHQGRTDQAARTCIGLSGLSMDGLLHRGLRPRHRMFQPCGLKNEFRSSSRLTARAKQEWRSSIIQVDQLNRHSCDAQRAGCRWVPHRLKGSRLTVSRRRTRKSFDLLRLTARAKQGWRSSIIQVDQLNRHSCDAQRADSL